VTSLERHYAEWDGLNLHGNRWKHRQAQMSCDRFDPLRAYLTTTRATIWNCITMPAPSAVAAFGDDIAYNQSRPARRSAGRSCFPRDSWRNCRILNGLFCRVERLYPGLNSYSPPPEALRRFSVFLGIDVIDRQPRNLTASTLPTAQDIRLGRAQ